MDADRRTRRGNAAVPVPEQHERVLNKEVRFLKGVGPQRAALLAKLGLATVRDLLFHLPRDYEDRRRITKIRDLNS